MKFKIPGNRNSVRMSDGHYYSGEVIYNNEMVRLPEDEIRIFAVDDLGNKLTITKTEIPKELPKPESKPVELPKSEDLSALKRDLITKKSVKDLKNIAKTIGLKIPTNIKEDRLVDLLLENGYRGLKD